MKNLLLGSFVLLGAVMQPIPLPATPVVANVTASQRASGDRAVDITYDVTGGIGTMMVTVLVSNDDGASYTITPQAFYLSGAVGPGIGNGVGNLIVWNALADIPEIYWPQTRIRVIATEEGGPSEGVALSIISDVAAPVHELANQTLTLTFDQTVTGFDASDILVTGATKGNFTGSGAVYYLELVGSGGRITVSVPDGSTSPANQASALSSFYQDTWTLSLPGSVPMELVRIPAGTLMMGSPTGELSRGSDELRHAAIIEEDFYLGRTEVTQAQWLAIAASWPGTVPSSTYGIGNDYPAYYVSHSDVVGFLTDLHGEVAEAATFSLPTEAQWEYAARAGTITRFSFGDGVSADDSCALGANRQENMWYCGNSGSSTRVVGQKLANPWGLHDAHGNVWEWCADWYGPYGESVVSEPNKLATGTARVLRGGSWGSGADYCRSATRYSLDPNSRNHAVGFRVAAIRGRSPANTPPRWTWMAGSPIDNDLGSYGTQGVESPTNQPRSRNVAGTWATGGSLYLFGGGMIAGTSETRGNDLWVYRRSTGMWTWLKGSSSPGQAAVSGTLGVAAAANTPGARHAMASENGPNGTLLMFGGYGTDNGGSLNYRSDVWSFDPAANHWTWLKGPSAGGQAGTYGSRGVAAAGNNPGARENMTSWSTPDGAFWVFGGYGRGSGGYASLNDLWKYDPATNNWAWISGSSSGNNPGVYGEQGVAAAGNSPGARVQASSWVDGSGNLWLFGGGGYDSAGAQGSLNDLWQFNVATGHWTWVKGSSISRQPGVYGTKGVAAPDNTPGARSTACAVAISNGGALLYSGSGYDSTGTHGYIDDVWLFNPNTGNWTWIGGGNIASTQTNVRPPVYGTLGVEDPRNTPAGRLYSNFWPLAAGDLWIFGGYAFSNSGQNSAPRNDLWRLRDGPGEVDPGGGNR